MEEPSDEIAGARFEMALEPDNEQTTMDYQEVNGFNPNGSETADRINRYPAGNSSAAGAVANYMNTIIGAAIVGLPFALKQSGLWAGIIMLCLAAILNGWSTYALIAAGEKVGKLNYEELMGELFGTPGVHAFCLFAGILAFGAMSAYLIIIGDIVPEILLAANVVSGAFTDRHSVIAFFGIFFVLPVSLLKDLSKLAYTSLASVCAAGLLGLIVIFAGPSEASENAEIDRSGVLDFVRPSIFAGFGAMSFAFVCQQSSFLVYRSMREGGLKRWTGVTKWSMSLAWIMSLVLSVSGYLIFATETQGNILNNFSSENIPATVARGFLTVTMLFTYPIEMYVARHVFDVSILRTFLGMGPITSTRHYAITLVIWAFTMTVACATDDLSIVLDIFGALSSTVIGYILPALLHISCNREDLRRAGAAWRKDSPEYDTSLCGRLWALRNFCLPVFMVVFGIVAMVTGVVSTIWYELKHFGFS